MTTVAEDLASTINDALKVGDVQICNYAQIFIVKRGSTVIADGNCIRINGKGVAFPIGSFEAYKH